MTHVWEVAHLPWCPTATLTVVSKCTCTHSFESTCNSACNIGQTKQVLQLCLLWCLWEQHVHGKLHTKQLHWLVCFSYSYVKYVLSMTSWVHYWVVCILVTAYHLSLYYSCWLWSPFKHHKWNVELQCTRTGPNTLGCNCHLHLQHWLHTEWKQHAYLPD